MRGRSAYLDNCISPTGVVAQQLPEDERAALDELDRRESAGTVELYTSDLVRQEIARTPSEDRRERLMNLFELYARVPLIDEEFRMPKTLGSSRSGLTNGPIVTDELLGRLSFLPDELDARHIFQAARNGVRYFVTRDCDTVLKYAPRILAEADVVACLPTQLIANLDSAAS